MAENISPKHETPPSWVQVKRKGTKNLAVKKQDEVTHTEVDPKP